jgi:hypothetical protein
MDGDVDLEEAHGSRNALCALPTYPSSGIQEKWILWRAAGLGQSQIFETLSFSPPHRITTA